MIFHRALAVVVPIFCQVVDPSLSTKCGPPFYFSFLIFFGVPGLPLNPPLRVLLFADSLPFRFFDFRESSVIFPSFREPFRFGGLFSHASSRACTPTPLSTGLGASVLTFFPPFFFPFFFPVVPQSLLRFPTRIAEVYPVSFPLRRSSVNNSCYTSGPTSFTPSQIPNFCYFRSLSMSRHPRGPLVVSWFGARSPAPLRVPSCLSTAWSRCTFFSTPACHPQRVAGLLVFDSPLFFFSAESAFFPLPLSVTRPPLFFFFDVLSYFSPPRIGAPSHTFSRFPQRKTPLTPRFPLVPSVLRFSPPFRTGFPPPAPPPKSFVSFRILF